MDIGRGAIPLQAGNNTTAVGDALRPAWLPEWIPTWSLQVLGAVLVLLLTYFVSNLVRKALSRRIARRFRRPSITRTVLRSVQLVIVLLGGLVSLRILDVELGNIALSVGVFTAVLGFVLAPIIGSVINGIFVLTDNAYEIGDMIELRDSGVQGFVEDITLRYTKIFTLDNTFMIIPNGTIRDRDVVNYSAEDARTRLSLDLLVTYESDVEAARRLMEAAAREVDEVIGGGPDIRIGSARYPAGPICYIENYADHGVNLRMRYWVTDPYRLLALRSAVQTNVWERLEDADVEIAYPHSHLVFDETSGEMQVAVSSGGGAGPRSAAARRPDADPADRPDDGEPRG